MIIEQDERDLVQRLLLASIESERYEQGRGEYLLLEETADEIVRRRAFISGRTTLLKYDCKE